MQDTSIQQVSPNSTALNAEHYQTFEMAKANDDVLANGTLKELINYQAQVRAMLEYTHKLVSTMSSWDEFTSSRAETLATEQAAANLNVFIDQRMGELVAALPTKQGKRSDLTSLPVGNKVTKTEALQDAGLTPKTASQLEQLAKNPEVVEAVIAKAEQDGRVVSRSQVLKAIKERDEARKDAEEVSELYGKTVVQRDQAESERKRIERELRNASITQTNLEMEAESLRQQLATKLEPEVIEREVEVVREVVPEDVQQRINELERLNNLYLSDYQKLRRRNEDMRKELDRAHDILNLDETTREVQRDVQYLVTSTNQYIRHYGGLTWTVQSLSEVDGQMIEELHKAVRNLATFANTLMNCLEEING